MWNRPVRCIALRNSRSSRGEGWEPVSRGPSLERHIRIRAVGSVGDCCAFLLEQRPILHPALCPSIPSHGVHREAYLPTQCPPPLQEARLSRSDEHSRRTRRAQVSARQGSRPPVRLIGRIRTRAEFERLRRDGRRVRIEPFWCSHLSDPTSNPPRVAFAISRAVGNAVIRNRLRRRLRAIMMDLDIPPGLYLIGCRPTASELSFDQIVSTLGQLPAKVDRTA